MATSYRYVDSPMAPSAVLDWFQCLPYPPTRVQGSNCIWLFFEQEGTLAMNASGEMDPTQSPIVAIIPPRKRRDVLFTVGEVRFLTVSLNRRFPGLQRINSAFSRWLKRFECVYSLQPGSRNDWNYYLEGSVKNYETPIFALPAGLAALQAGQYFIAEADTEFVIDKVCASLRLRGIDCHQTQDS